jgi:hypothetical protein
MSDRLQNTDTFKKINNSLIRVFNVKREILTLFNLPQLRYTTSIQYMFIVLFVLLFYIGHCFINIEDRSLLTYIATEIQLSYPEWIATCIQLKNLEKYLLLLNRNLAKCKDRFEFEMHQSIIPSYECLM